MGALDKLKSRTEWQAYLATVTTLFLNRFFDLGLETTDLIAMVAATFGYGVSRGLGKLGKTDAN